jgi:hypothetical protein
MVPRHARTHAHAHARANTHTLLARPSLCAPDGDPARTPARTHAHAHTQLLHPSLRAPDGPPARPHTHPLQLAHPPTVHPVRPPSDPAPPATPLGHPCAAGMPPSWSSPPAPCGPSLLVIPPCLVHVERDAHETALLGGGAGVERDASLPSLLSLLACTIPWSASSVTLV